MQISNNNDNDDIQLENCKINHTEDRIVSKNICKIVSDFLE